jgi:hypothetical protein
MNHLHSLFDNMDAWRHLPSYQLERRADIFFSIYLPDLLYGKFGVRVERVLPEFPIRTATIDPASGTNRSVKADYLVKLQDANAVKFVELKTDDGSRRDKQDEDLEKARQVGLPALLEGILEIPKTSRSKKKYRCLLEALQEMGLVAQGQGGRFRVARAGYDIEIVYIQPTNPEGKENVISFREAATIIEMQGDELGRRFARSLREWADVPAGENVSPNKRLVDEAQTGSGRRRK